MRKRQLGTGLLVIVIWLLAGWFVVEQVQQAAQPTVGLSQVAREVRAGQVSAITVAGDTLVVTGTNGVEQRSQKEAAISVVQ